MAQRPMIDFLFVVDDAQGWHRENMYQNPSHYSFLRMFGPRVVEWVQRRLGARIYYNTLVSVEENQLIKYGVISTADALDDLINWRTLYVSGRLHKPVQVLQPSDQIQAAMQTNLQHAVNTALLLLLPAAEFSYRRLFEQITALSYVGDFRMAVGENPRKVQNIVSGSLPAFVELYAPVLQRHPLLELRQPPHAALSAPDARLLRVHRSERSGLLQALPASVRDTAARMCGVQPDRRELAAAAIDEQRVREAVRAAVGQVVGRAAWAQSVKGLLTAGVGKSLQYAWDKVQKRLQIA